MPTLFDNAGNGKTCKSAYCCSAPFSASTLTAAESRLLSRFRALSDKKQLWLLLGIGFLEEDFDKN